jgi:beta-glucosidase
MKCEALNFPDGFLWGTATSSHQVEGDNFNNQWWAWEQKGQVWHNDKSGMACDWWHNAERDFDLAAQLHQNSHRLSLEWSRIEPKDGVFDSQAIGRYRQMLEGLRGRGLEPMVTLHHFTNPVWIEAVGGWENPATADYFGRYVQRIVGELDDLVDLWCTVNEPAVYAVESYFLGTCPPGKKSLRAALCVLRNLLIGHNVAYHTIHHVNANNMVGLVKHIQLFDSADPMSRMDQLAAGLHDYLFNETTLKAVNNGRLGFPLSVFPTYNRFLAGSVDFWGLNYYTREMVAFDLRRPGDMFSYRFSPEGAEMSDAGREGSFGEIYPEGLYRALVRLAAYDKPIYITENGLPDAADSRRPRFLVSHLAYLWRAIQDGVPVKGYYHWTLIDNFEWADGWGLRFGLVELDTVTQERKIRTSGELYSRVAQANALAFSDLDHLAPEIASQLHILEK